MVNFVACSSGDRVDFDVGCDLIHNLRCLKEA